MLKCAIPGEIHMPPEGKTRGEGGGGALKYSIVHMRDQNFYKTTLNEFLLPYENYP